MPQTLSLGRHSEPSVHAVRFRCPSRVFPAFSSGRHVPRPPEPPPVVDKWALAAPRSRELVAFVVNVHLWSGSPGPPGFDTTGLGGSRVRPEVTGTLTIDTPAFEEGRSVPLRYTTLLPRPAERKPEGSGRDSGSCMGVDGRVHPTRVGRSQSGVRPRSEPRLRVDSSGRPTPDTMKGPPETAPTYRRETLGPTCELLDLRQPVLVGDQRSYPTVRPR